MCNFIFAQRKTLDSAFNSQRYNFCEDNEELFSHADVHVSKIKLEHIHVHTSWWDNLLEGGRAYWDSVPETSYIHVEAIVGIVSSHTQSTIRQEEEKSF